LKKEFKPIVHLHLTVFYDGPNVSRTELDFRNVVEDAAVGRADEHRAPTQARCHHCRALLQRDLRLCQGPGLRVMHTVQGVYDVDCKDEGVGL
jgi:hypothetical protein